MESLSEHVNAVIASWPSSPNVAELLDVNSFFILNHFTIISVEDNPDGDITDKRHRQMRSQYKNTYELQLDICTVLRLIECSYLLGSNDVVLPHIVAEYGKLMCLCKILETELKRLNQFSELSEHTDRILGLCKPKVLQDMLYKDLEHLSNTYGVEVDFKQELKTAKTFALDTNELKNIKLKLA